MKTKLIVLSVSLFLLFSHSALATKLVEVKVIDKDYLMVSFKDGDVEFVDDGLGDDAHTNAHQTDNNYTVLYGDALNTSNAAVESNWVLKSSDDPVFGTAGLPAVNSYRKSKINGLAEMDWGAGDWNYEYTKEHHIILELPQSMTSGRTYTLEINSNTNTDSTSETFTYDIFNNRSEAIHINLVGFYADSSIKAADLYMWMGDGGARDYTTFEGNTVYIYNVSTQQSIPVSTVTFGQNKATETDGRYMIQSDVWHADFTDFFAPGTYRIAIEGVGCSEDFEISDDIFFEPFRVSTLGFFYMRIGQDNLDMTPVPRRPLYIPGVSPSSTKVIVTDMSPYHPDWSSHSGDNWDSPSFFSNYIKDGSPENPNAYGGHSDALDWDRHLGHVSIIYDMLLPYILTDGALSSDDLGIAESGNSIPDLLDEARNEVDFWLRLRYQGGYSHGLTNPSNNTLYQADNTPMAAWANAANAAMLADAFRIAGMGALMNQYRDAAIEAYDYASALPDQMLDTEHGAGTTTFRGRDLKMMAAAYLYNVTGNTIYEDVINAESLVTGPTSRFLSSSSYNQLYANAAYIKTNRTVNYPTLRNNMISAAVYQAKQREANYSTTRPSRRSIDNTTGWFHTEQHVQRTILAHAVATDPEDISFFKDALILEADWSLGRNSANVIQMTTATTALSSKKSVLQAYTSGWDDGSPGVHPGHTPYMNLQNWSSGMAMGMPTWLTSKGYPAISQWPHSEAYYDVRYIYAHSEFTPQQTMRGKQALYGYLSGIGEPPGPPVAVTGVSLSPESLTVHGSESLQLTAIVEPSDATNKIVLWESDNESVASVNASGQVTGVAVGSAVITATTLDGGFSDTSSVSVTNVDVIGVTVTPSSIKITEGNNATATARVLPATALNKSVSWSSDNTSVATVNENGLISALAAGSATITATTEQGGFTDSTQVTVEELPDELVIYRNALASGWYDGSWGSTINLAGTSPVRDGSNIVNVSSVNAWGGFQPILSSGSIETSGYTGLGFWIHGGSGSDKTIRVYFQLGTEAVGESKLLTVPAGTWTEYFISFDEFENPPNVSTLTFQNFSFDQIDGFSLDEIRLISADLVPVTGVSVSPDSGTIDGDTIQLVAEVLPSDATNKKVNWSSSDETIASVGSNGFVLGHSVGNVTITATTEDGSFTDSASIDVVSPTQGRVMKVMPLGDSITEGYNYGGAYRLYLWQNLEAEGLECGVDLVGSLDHHSAEGLDDPDHEGHSGWTTGQILANIDAYMAAATPDIVMMHLGTNDIAQDVVDDAPANLRALIDAITFALPADGKLYVAKIIPMGGVGNSSSIAYNDIIETAVLEKQAEGLSVYLVDAYSIWINDYYYKNESGNIADWTHPGPNGYSALGDFWFDVIKDDIQLPCGGITIDPGDINGDGSVDLADAIRALKVINNSPTTSYKAADVNGDNKIGLEEVLFILQAQ